MKKISLIVLVLFLLSACGSKKAAVYEEKVKLYQSYWNTIQDQPKYQKSSSNFSIVATIEAIEKVADEASDGEGLSAFKYDVIVDAARIAMYDVEILVVEGEEAYQDEKMMPSLGIFDDSTYHLIPNQSRHEKGYQSGFKLSGENDTSDLKLHIIVTWKNYTRSESFKEFFEITPKLID